MRRTLSILALCSAWLCANGALWDCVQVFAWGQMLHTYSRIMPLDKAIEKTFDGSAPCEICDIVNDARQQQPAHVAEHSSEKILLACHTPEPLVIAMPEFAWPGALDRTGLIRTETVPVPPPRV